MVIPGAFSYNGFYCDNSAGEISKGHGCMELDIFESDGHSLLASTMHTFLGTGGNSCNTWGCRQITYFGYIDGSQPFRVTTTVSNEGDIRVVISQNGKSQALFDGSAAG